MKHGLKPTKQQKIMMASKNLNYMNWLVVKDTPSQFDIVHRSTGTLKTFAKTGGKI